MLSRTVFPQTEAPGEDVIWDARAAFSSDRRANGGLLDVRLWGAVLAFAMAAILFVFW